MRQILLILVAVNLGGCAAKKPRAHVATMIRPVPHDYVEPEPVMVGAPATEPGWWKKFPETRIPSGVRPSSGLKPVPFTTEPEPVREETKGKKKAGGKKTAKLKQEARKETPVSPPEPKPKPEPERRPGSPDSLWPVVPLIGAGVAAGYLVISKKLRNGGV
jgi:hypothetical protein